MTRREFLTVLAAAGTSSCGYALAGRGSFLPTYIRVLGIPMFGNATPFQTVEQVFTQKVRLEFQSSRRYTVVPTDEGADGNRSHECGQLDTRNRCHDSKRRS